MKQKKSGFTLVEILVVIAISAIVLTMVGTTMVFMTQMTGDILQEAEDIDMAKNIEKYLRGLVNDKENPLESCEDLIITFPSLNNESKNTFFKIDNGNVIEIEKQEDGTWKDVKTIFSNTRLSIFSIQQEGDFIKCYMEFKSGKEFEFILALVK